MFAGLLACLFEISLVSVSPGPGWPQIHAVAEAAFDFWIFLTPPPECWTAATPGRGNTDENP